MQQIHAFLNRYSNVLLTWSGIVSILCVMSQGDRHDRYGCRVRSTGHFYQETDAKHLIPRWKADLCRMAHRFGEFVPIERGGEFFVVPPWTRHEFVNESNGELILFSVQATQVMEPLSLYHEDAYTEDSGHQQVTGKFEN